MADSQGRGAAAWLMSAAGPLAAAAAGHQMDVPGYGPAVLAVAAGGGMYLRDKMTGAALPARLFHAAVAAAAGAWTAWSTVTGPWHQENLIAGAAAATLGGLVALAFTGDDPQPAGPATPGALSGDRAKWKARIERIARVQGIGVKLTRWETGSGFDLLVTFAADSGDTWEQIASVAGKLAAAARLPRGCAITVSEGPFQGTALLRVPTVYALDKEVFLPADWSPLTIWGDLPLGVYGDGVTAGGCLRQSSVLLGGQRGSGKTNLEKVLISQLLRCPDSLVWVADLNGGGLAVPFMLPFAEGQVAHPPIDWVAASPEEAVVMAQAAAAIARDRKARYAGLTARSGGDLLPVSAEIPQITIVVDESAELEGNKTAKAAMEALVEVQRIGRAEAVNVVFSALRATMDTIPVGVRKQAALKACGKVADDTELGYFFPDAKIRAMDIRDEGVFFLQRGLGEVRQAKIHRALPQMLREGVVATEALRPSLDEPGAKVGGSAYAKRWDRLRVWLDTLAGQETAPAPAPSTVVSTSPAPVLPAAERAAKREAARSALSRAGTVEQVRKMAGDDLEAAFAGIVDGIKPTVDDGDKADGLAAWTPEMLVEIVCDAGAAGIVVSEIRDALDRRGVKVSDKTLFAWLKRYSEDEPVKLRRDSGRYWAA